MRSPGGIEGKKLLILAGMIATDEDALTCDFAETYHIYDFRALPVKTAAALAAGLPDNSRTLGRLSGLNLTLTEMLLAAGVDFLSMIVWINTKAARNEDTKPPSILAALMGEDQKKDNGVRGFETPEEFREAYMRAVEEVKHGNRNR